MTTPTSTSVVPFVVQAEGTGVAQRLSVAGNPGHVFHTDAYPAFGGADTAPSPLFYALGALTSCNQVTGSLVARDLGIALGRWTFEIRGDLDTKVLVHGAPGNANFERVSVIAVIETDATAEQFSTFISETARRCPVTQLFQRSGLQLENDWSRVELRVSA